MSDLKSLAERLSILNAVAAELNRSLDIDETLQTTLAQLSEHFNLETGWVWLLAEDTGASYLAAAQNLPPGLVKYPHKMEGSCYCLDVFRDGTFEEATNISIITCTRIKWLNEEGTAGIKYHASVPLYAHGRKIGVLNLASTDWRELSEAELKLLYTIGDLLGIAVERARLFERSVQLGAAEERNRLAREIHDTLAQDLAGLTLQLESADALLETAAEPAVVRDLIQQAITTARTSIEEVRRSVLDLRAAPLDGKSLVEALHALVEEAKSTQITRFHLLVGDGQRPLASRLEVGLYRIAQEALNNIGQHAGATEASLNVTFWPQRLVLIIEDNGHGFETNGVPSHCLGLMGMNERAKLLGGTMRLESSVGEGTRIEVEIPI